MASDTSVRRFARSAGRTVVERSPQDQYAITSAGVTSEPISPGRSKERIEFHARFSRSEYEHIEHQARSYDETRNAALRRLVRHAMAADKAAPHKTGQEWDKKG